MSGLSGTVVLQDNGGDELSLSASGGFTFATKLPAGAAYNVTVKTSPSGQTCTVANGSGTVGSPTSPTSRSAAPTRPRPRPRMDFNRANGGLGASWVAMSDGGLSIAAQQVVGRGGACGRYPCRRELRQRSVLADRGDLDPADGWPVDRLDRAQPERRSGHLPGDLLLEQRQPAAAALQAHRRHLHPARRQLYSGPLPAGTKLTLSAQGSTIASSRTASHGSPSPIPP